MKKQIAGVITAAALALGGVAFAGSAHADDYVVNADPKGTVTTHTEVGDKVVIKLSTGVVGLPQAGEATWKLLKGPKKHGKGTTTKPGKPHTEDLSGGALTLNEGGNLFSKPGVYWIQVKVKNKKGKTTTYKVRVVVAA